MKRKAKEDQRLETTLCGVAGEYFVAAELTRRGYIASITLRNTKGIDILASNAKATRSVGIQVKTNQHGKPDWILNKKAENYYSDNLFYVFVCLKGIEDPHFYIVPSKSVAEYATSNHRRWLKGKRRDGGEHKDTPMRKFVDKNHSYKDRWDLLGI